MGLTMKSSKNMTSLNAELAKLHLSHAVPQSYPGNQGIYRKVAPLVPPKPRKSQQQNMPLVPQSSCTNYQMEPSFSTMLQSPVTESSNPRSGMSATGTSHTYANLSMGLPPKARAPYNVVSPPGYGDAPSRYANYIDPSNYSNMANYGNSSNYSSASNYSDLDNFNSAASVSSYSTYATEEDLPPPPPPEPVHYANSGHIPEGSFPPPPPSPVSSSYSELRRVTAQPQAQKPLPQAPQKASQKTDVNTSTWLNQMYESLYEPVNPRPPSQLSSQSGYSSLGSYGHPNYPSADALNSQPSRSGRASAVDDLTNLLVRSMESPGDSDFFDKELQGKPFYPVDGKPYCEEDYLETLEKCSVCAMPILDRILRATGKPYHPQCFSCVACGKGLDGIPFTVDAHNRIHCIEDFHKKFAPRCSVCEQPIMPEPGQEETVRVVALDRSFHVNCYKCEMMIPRTSIPEEFDSQRYQSLPLAHSVDNGEEMPSDDPGVIHVIPESGRSQWNHIEDLDSFFTRVYLYHQKHGFVCMVLQEVFELAQFAFVVVLSVVLLRCVNYPILFRDKALPGHSNSTYEKISLFDAIKSDCMAEPGALLIVCLIIASCFWLLRLIRVLYHIIQYWEIRSFYTIALKIQDSELDNMTWHEVQTRLREVQHEHEMCIHKQDLTELDIYNRILRSETCSYIVLSELDNMTWHEVQTRLREVQHEHEMCIHKQDLTELDIYNRILRFKNYLVAMVNKQLVSFTLHIPLIGEVVFLTRGLKYNLELILFCQCKFLMRDSIKWMCLLVKREPGTLGMRRWSLYGRIYLRHFNELDHELNARLNRGYAPASKYMNMFTSPILAVIAQNIAFVSGTMVAVLAALSIWDEDVLNVEHVFFMLTIFTVIVAGCRVFIPEENLVWCPEYLMNAVLAHVHYLPDTWRLKAHTSPVRNRFAQLFQFKFVFLLEELLSPVLTPIILIFYLRPRSLEIVDFLRNFTVQVVGVGDVCSFAQMNIRRHGNPAWKVSDIDEGVDEKGSNGDEPSPLVTLPCQHLQAEGGKAELSLVHFTLTNPHWKPPDHASRYLTSLQRHAERDLATLNGVSSLHHSMYMLSSSSGILYESMHNNGGGGDENEGESLHASLYPGQSQQDSLIELNIANMSLSAIYLHELHRQRLKINMEEQIEETLQAGAPAIDLAEEEDVDVTEPKLKYERILNDVADIFRKDAASCIALNSKFLVLGSHWGMVYVLDHQGNAVRGKEMAIHATSINHLSLDEHGDFIASCSDDGKVAIHCLYSEESSMVLNLDRPVKSIAIDPLYFKGGSHRKFLTGDERLILHEKTFLKQKQTILHGGEGVIRTIRWRGQFVAWSTDAGVRVFDMNERRTISLIKKDHSDREFYNASNVIKQELEMQISPLHGYRFRPELLRCYLHWRDDRSLFIGWADTIKVCIVRKRAGDEDLARLDLPRFYVEIISQLTTDFFICGISSLEGQVVVLTMDKQEARLDSEAFEILPQKGQQPQLRILDPHVEDYIEESVDTLPIRNCEENKCNDYYLDCLPEEGLYFIVSPKDVVIGKLRDTDDHIDWLLEQWWGFVKLTKPRDITKLKERITAAFADVTVEIKFEEAMAEVERNEKALKHHTPVAIGRSYLDHMLRNGHFEQAAALCPKVLGKDQRLWEEEVYKFAHLKQLKVVAPYLPRGDFHLSSIIYEMVLFEFLKTNPEGLLKEWSPSLYEGTGMINAVLEHLLSEPENQVLLQTLAQLYSHARQFDKALAMYLKLKHKDVFEMIEKHRLVGVIEDKLEGLMTLDSGRATTLLLASMDTIPPNTVVKRLQLNNYFLYLYLDALYKKDPKGLSTEYHALLVRLYVMFDRPKLLPLLRNSSHYPLQEAFMLCRQHKLHHEMVFLLKRMGNVRDALKVLVEEIQDIKLAIDFCKECDDQDLWNDIIKRSLHEPRYIIELLRSIGTHVDPLLLLRQIPSGLKIPGLRDALVKILQDYSLQV
ncbi:unnamed protein product [Darwinula stevensoni]|uniref:Autophagy-related protein 9 n=1 Tax=Darwinula stevensoni TaxID=69355 RepID=A0A7R9A4V2_9CRUS|nr:unnamed protein product [Darwinula stevensoni]CAG0885065.1 unnamed protein product [Darwinula stevensoni]